MFLASEIQTQPRVANSYNYFVKFVYLTTISIFFPIYIQLSGRDAFTIGSVLVFMFCFILILKSIILKYKLDYLSFACSLIIISTISAFSIDPFFLDKSLRGLVQFVSAIMFFVFIFNIYKNLSSDKIFIEVERLIFFLVLMVSVQILIGCVLYYIPGSEDHLRVFSTRNKDALITGFDGGTLRLRTLVAGGEGIGECIAVFFPFVLYFLYNSNNYVKYLFLFLFIIGCALAVTRSAVVLMIFSCVFFYIKVFLKTKIISTLKGLYVATILIIICFIFFDSIFDNLIYRFSFSISDYKSTGSLIKTINRDGVWVYINQVVWPNISFFGNGMLTVAENKIFFIHSLYITLIHQFGIVGFIFFLLFFVHLVIVILRSYFVCKDIKIQIFLYCCFLSFFCFIVNEVKFEFNRNDSYQKIIWALFAVYSLSTHIGKSSSQLIAYPDLGQAA